MPGTGTARLAVEEMIAVRGFLNEGGKLLYTGKRAGQQYSEGNGFRNFGFPELDGPAPTRDESLALNVLDPQFCHKNGEDADETTDAFDGWPEFNEDDPTQADGCILHNDDFQQYYLGAYIYVSGGNTAEETDEGYFPFDMTGDDGPFKGLTWGFDETGAGTRTTRRRSRSRARCSTRSSTRCTPTRAAWRAGCGRVRGRSARSAASTTWPRTRTAPPISGSGRPSTSPARRAVS